MTGDSLTWTAPENLGGWYLFETYKGGSRPQGSRDPVSRTRIVVYDDLYLYLGRYHTDVPVKGLGVVF